MDEHEAKPERSEEEYAEDSAPNSNMKEASAADSQDEADDAQAGKAGDSLAWLEGPAFDAPIEEMPTLQWPDVEAEARAVEGMDAADTRASSGGADAAQREDDEGDEELEDAMQWLEALARQQGTPLDEMPTLISSGEREPGEAVGEVPELGATTQPPQLDSDPMAWLEQLAIDQNSPLEELPSVADRLLASEIASQTAIEFEEPPEPLNSQPAELEAALRYLEEQAAAQGISLNEVSYDEEELAGSTDEDLAAVDQMAAAAVAAAVGETRADQRDEELADAVGTAAPEVAAAGEQDDLAWLGEEETSGAALVEPDALEEVQAAAAEDPDAGVLETEVAETEEEKGSLLAKAGTAVTAAKIVGAMAKDDDEELAAAEEVSAQEEDQGDATVADEPAAVGEGDGAAKAAVLVEAHAEEEGGGDDTPQAEAGAEEAQESAVPAEHEAVRAEDEEAPAAAPQEDDASDGAGSLLKKAAAAAAVKKTADMLTADDEVESEEAEAPVSAGQTAEAAAAEADILDSMPDDPDEAMAWMGALAAEEAPGEDLVEAPTQGLEKAAGEQVLDEDALDGMPDDPDEAMKWMAALAAKEATTRLQEKEPPPGDEVREEAPVEEQADEIPEPPPIEQEAGTGAGLVAATDALEGGDVAAAVTRFRTLLDSGEERGELIAALQTAVQQKPEEPALKQVLGDAYMQDGQVQQALRMYREGLTNN